MRYALARYNNEQRTAAYRIYVTDSLFYMGQNMHPTTRFVDVLNKKQDNRSADEIAVDVIIGAGLSFGGELQ